MKKLLLLVLAVVALMMFSSCAASESPYDEKDIWASPENGIYQAPDTFYLEWDIPTVRDIFRTPEGTYNLPIYRFDTYAEFLHLKEIVGAELLGGEVKNEDYCYKCGTVKSCAHELYNEEFFEYNTLLIAWFQYDGVMLPETLVDENGELIPDFVNFDTDHSLRIYLEGYCVENGEQYYAQWIFVAVPKPRMEDFDTVTIMVDFPKSQDPNENPEDTPNDEANSDSDPSIE